MERKVKELLNELVEVSHEMEKKGLVSGSVGNVSARVDDNRILISSHSSFLGRIIPEEFVMVKLDGEKLGDTDLEPSSEIKMHLQIYLRRDDINAIVHTHSPYASAYAFLKRKLKAVNPETMFKLGEIPIVSYFPSGTKEFAQAVGAQFRVPVKVALLEKHGVVAAGKTPREALNLAEMVEESARINYLVDTLQK